MRLEWQAVTTLLICRQIRHVQGGYIVELRWPYGPDVGGYGEVICETLDEVFDLLRKADVEEP